MHVVTTLILIFLSGCATKMATDSNSSGAYSSDSYDRYLQLAAIIFAAVIGAVGTLLAARIQKKSVPKKEINIEVLNEGIVSGDIVGEKTVQYIRTNEEKSKFSYWFQKIYSFVFTLAVSGFLFGSIGYEYIGIFGAAIGAGIALALSYVMQDHVSKYKGII